ncbi:hypothetical protein [Thermus sp.]
MARRGGGWETLAKGPGAGEALGHPQLAMHVKGQEVPVPIPASSGP